MKETVRLALPRRTKAHRIKGGPLRGSLIYTSWHDYPGAIRGTTEHGLLDWFGANVKPGQTWLDVGAHYGYTAIALGRLVGSPGRVFAFEPVLGTAAHLAKTVSLNGLPHVAVLPMGLGDAPTITSRRLTTRRGMVEESAQAVSDEAEVVQFVALDSIWPLLAGDDRRVDGVKIDVQGMELSTLKGMQQMLGTHHPFLIVEFHHGVDRGAVLALLGSAGYSAQPWSISTRAEVSELIDDESYLFGPARP
jgi:FkbM family methyltransferase